MHETRRNMYKGSSGEGLSLRDIQHVHWDCRTEGAAGEQAAPGSGYASVRSGVVLRRRCCMWFIYKQLPAESRRDGTRVWGKK